ncbi:MAG: hypothetical protein ACXWBP_06790 [Limisphaerales bacterium]
MKMDMRIHRAIDFSHIHHFKRKRIRMNAMDVEKVLRAAAKWDAKYRRAVVDAIRRHQPELADKIIQRYLSRERRAEFNLTNTYARRIFRHELVRAVLAPETNPFQAGPAVMWAGITHRPWACCDLEINFSYQDAKRKIRNALKGMNFIGVIEPGYYPNVEWDNGWRVGCLVSFHAHIVVWDTSISKLRRRQRKIEALFLPVTPDDRRATKFYELTILQKVLKVLRYSTKMSFEGYDKQFKANSVKQSHTDLQPLHHYRLFRFMRKHTLWDAWLAGGEGAELLRSVRKAALKVARDTG